MGGREVPVSFAGDRSCNPTHRFPPTLRQAIPRGFDHISIKPPRASPLRRFDGRCRAPFSDPPSECVGTSAARLHRHSDALLDRVCPKACPAKDRAHTSSQDDAIAGSRAALWARRRDEPPATLIWSDGSENYRSIAAGKLVIWPSEWRSAIH